MTWIDDPGIGYLPLTGAQPYDATYFEKYLGYAQTDLGRALNEARLALVARHWTGSIVDIGIGCGQFVESRPATWGYDVNPAGVEWLRARSLYLNPYRYDTRAITCWDSLEHIADPTPLLAGVREMVFVAVPIFRNLAHVRASKHFRPDEHCWYFTRRGLIEFMGAHAFTCVEENDDETRLGREDIRSFAFRRAR